MCSIPTHVYQVSMLRLKKATPQPHPHDACHFSPRPLAPYPHLKAVVIDELASLDDNSCVAGCSEHRTIRSAATPRKMIGVTDDSDFRVRVAIDDASTFLMSLITLECRAAENDCPAGFLPIIARHQPDCSALLIGVPGDGGKGCVGS